MRITITPTGTEQFKPISFEAEVAGMTSEQPNAACNQNFAHIDLSKEWKTKDGQKVEGLYHDPFNAPYCLIGRIANMNHSWCANGWYHQTSMSHMDLVEAEGGQP